MAHTKRATVEHITIEEESENRLRQRNSSYKLCTYLTKVSQYCHPNPIYLGRTMGLEPTTTGITIRDSTN